MRILQVTPTFVPSKFGGIKMVSYNLSKALVKKGHEVTVYTTDADMGHSRLRNIKNIKNLEGLNVIYFKNISNLLAFKHRLFLPMGIVMALKKEIKNFDIIHIHGFRGVQEVITHKYAKKYGIPYIIDPQGSIVRTIKKQKLKRIFDIFFGYRLMRDAYKVIAGTEMEKDEEKSMGVNEEKIVLILPGYDVNSFSNLPDPGQFRNNFSIKERSIILFLGRIHEIKGVDFLVKSFSELTHSKKDIILVIVGPDDGYKSIVEKLIDELNISSKILFTGFLDGDEKLSAYVDATIFVQPSKYERFCGSPFEAILCNTPIIVTKNTGCGNFVNKMGLGYTVNYGDVNELRNTMEEILSDLPKAHVKTQRGKQYIISNLTWEKQIEKYEKLYHNAIEGVK